MSDSCSLQFLNEVNLTYQRLTGFVASFYFIPIVLVPWGRFPLCHTPIRSFFDFLGSDLNLDCGLHDHVITRFVLVGIRVRLRNKVISLCDFCFLCLCHLSKKKVIFHLGTVSNHISSIYIKLERERERERERGREGGRD